MACYLSGAGNPVGMLPKWGLVARRWHITYLGSGAPPFGMLPNWDLEPDWHVTELSNQPVQHQVNFRTSTTNTACKDYPRQLKPSNAYSYR